MKINQDIHTLRNAELDLGKVGDSLNPTYNKFCQSSLKIAIQKGGELTKPSLEIFRNMFGYKFQEPADRELATFEGDGDIAIVWSRNKSIHKLVSQGAVDMAIVGSDQLIERGRSNSIITIKTYEDVAQWPLVLAVVDSSLTSIMQIKTIVTQYPKSARLTLGKVGLKPKIITVEGGAEIYAYLQLNNNKIDAVVDISVTGRTLKQNNMRRLDPHLAVYYPVLICNKNAEPSLRKRFPDVFSKNK